VKSCCGRADGQSSARRCSPSLVWLSGRGCAGRWKYPARPICWPRPGSVAQPGLVPGVPQGPAWWERGWGKSRTLEWRLLGALPCRGRAFPCSQPEAGACVPVWSTALGRARVPLEAEAKGAPALTAGVGVGKGVQKAGCERVITEKIDYDYRGE